jgi:hypothetical protein
LNKASSFLIDGVFIIFWRHIGFSGLAKGLFAHYFGFCDVIQLELSSTHPGHPRVWVRGKLPLDNHSHLQEFE